ncbi:hypothetical protein G9H36_27695, partial [Escherichia coli]|nr:hypothetical protein [Escherichia coli]
NMPQSDADKLVLFNLMPWPREEVINTTVRLRGSQFNLRDGRGQPVPYFIRHVFCQFEAGDNLAMNFITAAAADAVMGVVF